MATFRPLTRFTPTEICTSSIAFQPRRALARTFGTTRIMQDEVHEDDRSAPRWQQTPARMKMPFRVRPLPSRQPSYNINSDPHVLHGVYDAILGSKNAYTTLPEELRWLAVTHKSFDHGRRGSNDRLAFLGESRPMFVTTRRYLS